MTIFTQNGKRVDEIDLVNMFPASEGKIAQIYGRIGSGKTYVATRMVLDLLRKGKVVYVNWKLQYNGYDERSSVFRTIITLVFPWLKRFYVFPKENLHYFEFSDEWAIRQGFEDWADWFSHLTDCDMFGDEGHVMFDSYVSTRMSMEKRAAVLHTRHFNRSITIISQRPTAIHVAMRANVNVFYRCEKSMEWPIIRFRLTEFQDMNNETVDESDEKIISVRGYFGRKSIFNAYDTKYLRGDMPPSQEVKFEAYDFGYLAKLTLLWKNLFGSKIKKS